MNPPLTPSTVTLGASYGSRGERVTRQAAPPRRTKHGDSQLPDNQTRLAAALCDGPEGIAPPVPAAISVRRPCDRLDR
ncbi:hypothetical protein [Streptomyces coeruleorubidus]